jgi:mannosyltransferase OCH1-like enzyme
MPEDFRRWGETWRQHHPDWEMRLWGDADVSQLTHGEAIRKARHWAEKTDVMRYELIARHGGVYVDTDFECLRSIEPLIDGIVLFAGEQRPGKLGNALLGATPGHPLVERLAAAAAAAVGTQDYPQTTGPPFFHRFLSGAQELTVFPPEFFYPYHWKEEPRESYPGAYAVHHWGMSWQDPDRREALRLRARVHTLERERDALLTEVDQLKRKLDRGRKQVRRRVGAIWRRRG